MEMMRKIEMSNMLIEKERKKEKNKNEKIDENSVCCNEEIMQPMNKLFIVF
jgi:hypothetical protein